MGVVGRLGRIAGDSVGRLVRGHWPALLGAVGLTVLWALFPHYYLASDEFAYASRAHALLDGSAFRGELGSGVFTQRLGVYAPVAAVYATFGVGPHSTNFVLLAAAWVVLGVVSAALPDVRARWFGTLFVVGCVPLLVGVTELLPDLLLAAYLALAALLVSRRLSPAGARRSAGALAAGLWFLAFLCKENAYYLLPVWLAVACLDLARRRYDVVRSFHAWAVLTASLLLAGYLVFCHLAFDDALARVAVVEGLTGRHHWTLRSSEAVLRRLTTAPLKFFWDDFGVLPIAAALAYPVVPRRLKLWAGVLLVYTLLFWFGTTSVSSYQPLPLRQRMCLLMVPPMCILGACLVARAPLPRVRFGLARDVVVSALLLGLLVPRVSEFVQSWRPSEELAAMRRVRKLVRSQPETDFLLVTGDERAVDFLRIYFGFRYPENLKAAYAGALDAKIVRAAERALVVVSRHRTRRARAAKKQAERIRELKLAPFHQSRQIQVYEVADPTELQPLVRRRKRRSG